MRLFKQKVVRSFAGCADLNLAGICWVSCRKFIDAVMAILSGQSVISRVYTSRFGNGTDRLEPQLRWYEKVPGTVPSGKPPKSEPYRTVPCRTMQWKSAIRNSPRSNFSLMLCMVNCHLYANACVYALRTCLLHRRCIIFII